MIPQPVGLRWPQTTRVLAVIPQLVETLAASPGTDPSLGGGDPTANGNFAPEQTRVLAVIPQPVVTVPALEQTLRLEVEIRLVILVAITMVVAYPMLIFTIPDAPVTISNVMVIISIDAINDQHLKDGDAISIGTNRSA